VEEISIRELLAVLRRGLALLIVIPLVVTSIVGAYYFMYAENQYTAEAKLYVLIDYEDTTGSMRYDVNTSTSFAGDYQQLIITHEVLSAAAKKLGVKDFDELTIDVTSQANTRVICLLVTGTDPSFCMNAANTISEVFIEYLTTITQTKSVSIASKALVPDKPSGPSRTRNTVIALIASILIVACLLIATAMMNNTLRTSEDVENSLHIPVLARIAGYKKEMAKFMSQKGVRKPLYYSVSSETREGIKTLSMNLQFVSGNSAVKTLAITSATPNEGKSTISIMLATSLAEEGKRVLLVDMDFRNPSLGKYLGVRNRLDIVDVMQGTTKIDQIIMETGVKGLFVVDIYHKRVLISNVIQSSQYQEFIGAVGHLFDYVILDTPPIGFFIDSAVLASVADRTLLVVASGHVERALGKEIVNQLQKANASIIGVALNFIDDRNNHYGRYYRHYNKYGYNRSNDENDLDIPDSFLA
jgi:polysaccharide biosynthesis transport protein